MFSWLFSIAIGIAKFYIEEIVVPTVVNIGSKIVYNCLGIAL